MARHKTEGRHRSWWWRMLVERYRNDIQRISQKWMRGGTASWSDSVCRRESQDQHPRGEWAVRASK